MRSNAIDTEPGGDHFILRDAQDVKCGYALFLMRMPENDDHTRGWIGKSLLEMAESFLTSPEFGFAIAPRLAAAPGSQPTFGIVSGEVSIQFRHAMRRFCGLDPAGTLAGMSGWRWALFWLLTLDGLRQLASKISLSNGQLLSMIAQQVTWDVYGSLENEKSEPESNVIQSESPNPAPLDAQIKWIDGFGLGGCIDPSGEQMPQINARLFGQPLWPIFSEREAAAASTSRRFAILFNHPTSEAALRKALESQLRLARRGQPAASTQAFTFAIKAQEKPFDVLLTAPTEIQDLSFWAGLLDIDLPPATGVARDQMEAGRSHWATNTSLPKLIAFYLPQFHPFPENNSAWGEGFSEWTNVVTAQKLFPDHAAPLIPADLGYYDLRSRSVRARQSELAAQSGIFGFCYYFYWFNGRQVMGDVLQRILRDGEPELPFCLCWANENWSRRWDGSDDELIVGQSHDSQTDAAIVDDLARFFDDPRYIRINGAPLLLVYHLSLMDDPAHFVCNLRNRAKALGFEEIALAGVLSHGEPDPVSFGCDYGVQFPPHEMGKRLLDPQSLGVGQAFDGAIYDYAGAAEAALSQTRGRKVFPGVMPRWDNVARRGQSAHLFQGSTPALFKDWLHTAIARTKAENPEAPFVFINSWNEWAEGAVLEPDRAFGRGYLDAVREALSTPLFESGDQDRGDDAAKAALIHENKFLASWLSAHRPLLRAGPLQPGLPPVCADKAIRPGAGARLELVDGFTQTRLEPMPAGTSCVLQVHSVGDPASETLYRYLKIEPHDHSGPWFLPCAESAPGDDVTASFQIGLSTRQLAPGFYKLSILEITAQACHESVLQTSVQLT